MDDQTVQKLKDTLVKSNNIGIAVGADPSVDTMAGALSLYLLLKAANKQVSVACPTEPIVELSSLVGINRVQRNLGGEAGDLVVSFPYVEGEIEKVSYTLEEGFLNIIVKASEQGLSFDENDVKYVRGSGAIDLLIVVGTPRLAELEDVFDAQKLRDVRTINIDNKENNQGFGDIVLVSSRFSSVSEQVADLAMALGFRMDQDVAQNLLTGITTETRNFQTPNVTPLTFEMMALLMKRGAARRQIESQPQGFGAQPRPQYDDVDMDQPPVRPTPQPTPQPRQQMDRRPQEDRQDRRDDRRPQEDRRQQQQAERPQDDRRARDDQRPEDRRQQQQDRRPQQPDDRRRFDDRDKQPQQQARPQENRRPRDDQRQDEQRRREDTRQAQQNQNRDEEKSSDDDEPPLDWLTPKVYKGSSDVD
jgi:hypothetical protein